MLEYILTFLAENKAIIIGTAATITEVATIVVNFVRKTKSDENIVQIMMDAESSTQETSPKSSTGKKLLWSANPINLFKNLP